MKTTSHPRDPDTTNPANPTGGAYAVAGQQKAHRHPNQGWMPRPWREELAGCVFLPRMLDKGRRALEGLREGRDLMNGYLFGDFDYADGQVLAFLRTSEARVLELLGENSDDRTVATTLLKESGRSPEEVIAWSRRFQRINRLFGAMWDADEGRRAAGWGTSLLNGFYNRLMMPPVYLLFRIQTAWRRGHRSG